MSAWVLGALPFAVSLAMAVLNPKYLSLLLTDPIGTKLLWTACGMIVVGVLWLRKVIHIHG
jgi:tight adherence protein B